MSSDLAIRVHDVSKRYEIYRRPSDRLKQSVYPAVQDLLGLTHRHYFTEFWALPDEVVGGEVHLGIVSHEPITTDFTVRIESGGQPFTSIDGIRLAPGAGWDGVIELPPAPSPSASPSSTGGPTPRASMQPSGLASTMRATLYRAGSEAPYREVTIRGQSPT